MNDLTLPHIPAYFLSPVEPYHCFSYQDTLAEDVLGWEEVEQLRQIGWNEQAIYNHARQELVKLENGFAHRSPELLTGHTLMPVYENLSDMVAEEILSRLMQAVKDGDTANIKHWQQVFNTICPYL